MYIYFIHIFSPSYIYIIHRINQIGWWWWIWWDEAYFVYVYRIRIPIPSRRENIYTYKPFFLPSLFLYVLLHPIYLSPSSTLYIYRLSPMTVVYIYITYIHINMCLINICLVIDRTYLWSLFLFSLSWYE